MMSKNQFNRSFFTNDVLEVAPKLLGNFLVRQIDDDKITRSIITEVEAYRGTGDLACHANKGRTKRTEIMYATGGFVYIYLIYGIHWMLNIVTGLKESPQAILIRGIEGFSGPGRVTRQLDIDKSFYGEDVCNSERLWIEESGITPIIETGPRIGVDYAGEYWAKIPWRFWIKGQAKKT
jgi:DNA-3-methyladenine glycosylase